MGITCMKPLGMQARSDPDRFASLSAVFTW